MAARPYRPSALRSSLIAEAMTRSQETWNGTATTTSRAVRRGDDMKPLLPCLAEGCRQRGTPRSRTLTIALVVPSVLALAACGSGKEAPIPTPSQDQSVVATNSPANPLDGTSVSGRPTLSADDMTMFAEITVTPAATSTPAEGSMGVLAVSTVSSTR